jgi:hypothetical protein
MTTGWSRRKVGWMHVGSITDDIIASSTPATVALPLVAEYQIILNEDTCVNYKHKEELHGITLHIRMLC